jgi:protein-disulfide isomerase
MAELTPPVNPSDHWIGREDAPLTLVEYGDFESDYCGAVFPVVSQVRGQLDDSLRFVFRHFPLTQSHPHAQFAAEAAEAAAVQERFWQMHDLLFRHQDSLDENQIFEYARLIGLDMDRFRTDIVQHRFAPIVHDHFLSGVRSGVNGTPTFFINGTRFEGYFDLPGLLETLRSSLPRRQQSSSRAESAR